MSKSKKNESFNTVFFGTPEFSVYALEELFEAGITPSVVVTQPDKPAGRGLSLTPSPVKQYALERDIPVIQPQKLAHDDPETDILWNTEWDVFIVAAYGKLIPPAVLALPREGALNIHPSLLPKYRGPSPIESQVLADDKNTGVSIMLLDEEMDHGPLVAQASVTPEEWPLKRRVLEEILAREGGRLLAESLVPYMEHELTPEPQNHSKATFTKKIEKEDGRINLADDAYRNYLKFCAYEKWPGTFFFIEKKSTKLRIKIIEASYKEGVFAPLSVIPEGKREMKYKDFLRGS